MPYKMIPRYGIGAHLPIFHDVVHRRIRQRLAHHVALLLFIAVPAASSCLYTYGTSALCCTYARYARCCCAQQID